MTFWSFEPESSQHSRVNMEDSALELALSDFSPLFSMAATPDPIR
jgi:hypothetical protein